MTPIWAWARRELTRHRRAALALVLLVGVSGAVVLTTAAGARRTGSAFERFIESSNAADVRLQYFTESVDDQEVIDALLADPSIEAAVPLYITLAFAEGSDFDLGVFASPDPALLTEIDVPRLLEGRRPDPSEPHEVLINRFLQEDLGVKVGDTFVIGTFSPEQFNEDEDNFTEPAGPEIPLEVVGISMTVYDVADPESPAIYGTPAFYEQYSEEAAGFGPTLEIATTPGGDPGSTVEEVIASFQLDEVFVEESVNTNERVADGSRVLAVGLWTFAAVAGLAALVAAAQALHRRMAETTDDLPALRAMGFTRGNCVLAVATSVLPTALLGVALAVVIAILASVMMPIGIARTAEPSPGLDVDGIVLGLGALLLFALLAASIVFGTVRATGVGLSGSADVRARRPSASLLASGRFSPSSQLGVSMALDPGAGRTSVPVRSALLGVALGVAGVVGAITFGNGLDALVERPAASGWNWTFRPDVADEDVEALLAVDGVEDAGTIRFGQVLAEGRRMAGVSMRTEQGTPSFTVLEGHMPSGPREVALGPKTADELGVSIGDPIRLTDSEAADGEREAVMVGEVLLPEFDDNPFNEGIALAPDTLDAVAQSDGFEELVISFEDGVDEDEAARRVRAVLPDALGAYAFPSPPPDVANLSGVQFLPRVLGLFLGLLALAAVGHALATSVRRRRHDLGIVRSIGFVGREVLRTLTAQSWTLVAIGLVAGIPLGIAIGRTAWGFVAEGIGVQASASTSSLTIVAVALVSGLAGALLSLLPGLSAARQRAVDALRVE